LGLKKITGNILLRKEFAIKRKRKPTVAFGSAKLVGILYNAEDAAQKQMVKRLMDFFKEQKKECVSLGYFNTKEFPAGVHDSYGHEFFNKKFLNWAGLPTHHNVANFIRQDFDFLISLDANQPLHFLSLLAQSKAGCRVGPYSKPHAHYYDLMIDPKGADFAEETIRYLQKLG